MLQILLLALLATCRAEKSQGTAIRGRLEVRARANLAAAVVRLHSSTGEEFQAFCDDDGTFEFANVPPGSHMVQPDLMGFYFPEVRLDVTAKGGLVRASYLPPHDKQLVGVPTSPVLLLRSLGELQYFERRKPVDLFSILKSPYGIMIGISVLAIFVFPKMKVDPDEYKEFQASMRGGTTGGSGGATQARIQGR